MDPASPRLAALDCEDARARIVRFAEHTLPAEQADELRAHLLACPECRDLYRASIESAARMGAAARERREREEADEARARRVRDSVEGQQEPKKHRHWRLRTLILPAFFGLLILQVFREQQRGPRFVVEGAIGHVEVTGRPVEAYGDREIVLRRGSRCITGPNSSAKLVEDGLVVEVGSESEFMVIGFDPAHGRLVAGELAVQGPIVIETVLGTVLVTGVDARGRVVFEDHGLLVVPRSGRWTFRDASGDQRVPLGEHRRFRP